jgi:hypothetical protein
VSGRSTVVRGSSVVAGSGRSLLVRGSGRRIVLAGLVAVGMVVLGLLWGCVPALGFAATPSGFGFAAAGGGNGEGGFDGLSVGSSGAAEVQAGAHPKKLTFTFALNSVKGAHGEVLGSAGGELRDLELELPAGLVLNGDAPPRCTRRTLDEEGACAAEYQVGEVTLDTASGGQETSPVFDMVAPGTTAGELAFRADGVDVVAFTSLRTGVLSPAEGGFDLSIFDLPPEGVVGGRITLFGVTPGGAPFLTLPTLCAGPVPFVARADTWQDEASYAEASFLSHETPAGGGGLVGIEGCDHLGFDPSVTVSTDTRDADTAAGLTVNVKSPQEGLLSATGLGSSNIQGTSVLLPEGLVLDPNRAEGLASCPLAESGIGTEGSPSCPATSQVGTLQVSTPILPDTIEGGVYVLPSSPPDLDLLLSGYADGTYLKMVGVVALNEATGRVTLSFPDAPLLPFSDVRVSLSGGAQAALVTPAACGVYVASSDTTPWVTPAVGDAFETGSIEIASEPSGGACVRPLPFSATLTAGSSNDGAGDFASFSMLIERPDGQQRLAAFQFTAPPGLLGMFSSVPVCGEPQASQGACPAGSQVGHAILGAGPGGYPLYLPAPGQPQIPVYLTGPYEGAPYGLAIVVPFLAGPFDLGTKVLRARIEVDPATAQLKVTSDPLPTILKGVPLDLRTIDAVIDRPAFMFNPTDCSPASFQGSASSVEGATVALATPFQVGSCQSLQFTPTLKLSTAAQSSKQNGAALNARISFPESRQGAVLATSQANLQSVKLTLPKQLPARQATLKGACPAATYQANPASCPAASIVGHASASTPVLANPLSGPAYLVSRPGETYPTLNIPLQGSSITLDLQATTAIKKKITTTTFTGIPDVPLSSLELTLPAGPHSLLATNTNPCTTTLTAPTRITAQNGAVINQATKLTTTGCPKTTTKHTHPKHATHTKKAKKATRRRTQ